MSRDSSDLGSSRSGQCDLPYTHFHILTQVFQCAYGIFKKYEPRNPTSLVILLVFVPLTLAFLFPLPTGIVTSTYVSFPVYYMSLSTCIVLYRLSPWHPLALYPGPLACKLSKLHMACISQKGKQHLYLCNLHQRYGDIVRVGKNSRSSFASYN